MRTVARKYSTHPTIRELALEWTRGLPDRAYKREAMAIYRNVRRRVRFVRDIDGVETIQSPIVTLKKGAADCDGISTLIAALLLSIGHRPTFKVVDMSGRGYSHVYVVDVIRGKPFPLDASDARYPAGRQVSGSVRSSYLEV